MTPEDIEKRIGEWKEIALFLRRNVVQGERGDDGSYRTYPPVFCAKANPNYSIKSVQEGADKLTDRSESDKGY